MRKSYILYISGLGLSKMSSVVCHVCAAAAAAAATIASTPSQFAQAAVKAGCCKSSLTIG